MACQFCTNKICYCQSHLVASDERDLVKDDTIFLMVGLIRKEIAFLPSIRWQPHTPKAITSLTRETVVVIRETVLVTRETVLVIREIVVVIQP